MRIINEKNFLFVNIITDKFLWYRASMHYEIHYGALPVIRISCKFPVSVAQKLLNIC